MASFNSNAHRNVAHLSQVKDRDVIIVDDMIDTANTTCKAARLLRKHGARRVFVFATHGIFTDKAPERIGRSSIEEVRRWRGVGVVNVEGGRKGEGGGGEG